MTSQNQTESIIKCRHCGVPIGEVTDPWGGKHGWTHRPEDGPDAYTNCVCKCSSTNPLCIEGEEAEPELSLVDGLLLTVDRVTPDCTCAPGEFWKHKVHSPLCARRIATQEQSNEAAMANFHQGVAR